MSDEPIYLYLYAEEPPTWCAERDGELLATGETVDEVVDILEQTDCSIAI